MNAEVGNRLERLGDTLTHVAAWFIVKMAMVVLRIEREARVLPWPITTRRTVVVVEKPDDEVENDC